MVKQRFIRTPNLWLVAHTYYKITATDYGYFESSFSSAAGATTHRPTRGDIDNNGVIDVGDVVFLTNYLFKNGVEPAILAAADVNNDGVLENPIIDLGDVVYLINYLFRQGDPPVYLEWPNHPPRADAGDDQISAIDISVSFDASGSYDLDGQIVTYEWDFGDDNSGIGLTTSHNYTTNGTYIVTLTVFDNEGQAGNDTCIVKVLPPGLHVPEMYETIQDAIDIAFDGNTILVAPGTYHENIDFLGKAITVKSTDGPEVTIIDGDQNHNVVTFNSDETANSVLDGFTISNGSDYDGGGINCYGSSPVILGNIITQNGAFFGGGISCTEDSLPVIKNNIITNNTAIDSGGGIFSAHSWPIITNNVITNNSADETGGGICYYTYYGDPISITNNIIINNIAGSYGGGIYSWGPSPTITFCNVWNNTPDNYYACDPDSSCIEDDPQFIEHPICGPYYLDESSPCIDTGNPSPEYNDIEDPNNPGFALPPGQNTTRNDMGCYGGPTPLIYYGS
jgi:hypothetical protein